MAKDWDYWKNKHIRVVRIVADSIISIEDSKKSTPIEKIAALKIRYLEGIYGSNNLFITPEKRIGKYRVDFEIIHKPYFLPESSEPLHKIIVECDGHDFHEKTKQQVSKDKERDRFLIKQGYIVLRYSGSDIFNNPLQIVQDIDELMNPNYYKEVREALERDGYSGKTS